MDSPVCHSHMVQFGIFEAKLTARKLWKRSSPPSRKASVINVLEHPGEVVTRGKHATAVVVR